MYVTEESITQHDVCSRRPTGPTRSSFVSRARPDRGGCSETAERRPETGVITRRAITVIYGRTFRRGRERRPCVVIAGRRARVVGGKTTPRRGSTRDPARVSTGRRFSVKRDAEDKKYPLDGHSVGFELSDAGGSRPGHGHERVFGTIVYD